MFKFAKKDIQELIKQLDVYIDVKCWNESISF